MAATGDFDRAAIRALDHAQQRFAQQQVGGFAAHCQHRHAQLVPERPQHHVVRRAAREGLADRRIVAQAQIALARFLGRVEGEMHPFRVGQFAEGFVDFAQISFNFLEILEPRIAPAILADALQGGGRHKRPDIVEHQLADEMAALGGKQHADQPAHRRADPVELGNVEPRVEGGDGLRIDRIGIIVGAVKPIRRAAPRHIGAHDAPAVMRQRAGQRVEIAAVARQAVDADHGAVGGAFGAPFRPSETEKAAGAEHGHFVVARSHVRFVPRRPAYGQLMPRRLQGGGPLERPKKSCFPRFRNAPRDTCSPSPHLCAGAWAAW